jgi:hypothetical protein
MTSALIAACSLALLATVTVVAFLHLREPLSLRHRLVLVASLVEAMVLWFHADQVVEGVILLPLSHSHGITSSDLAAAPALLLVLAAVRTLFRSPAD